MATKNPWLATFGLLFGATMWGVIWYPYRLLEQAGIAGAAASAATYTCALLLGVLLLGARRRPLRVGRGFVVLALTTGWSNLGYVLAVIHGEVMRVLLLFYLAPLWTLLLARLLLGEKTGRRGLMVIVLSMSGAFIMLWQPEQGLPLPRDTSEWLGLSAGMTFALSNVLTRRSTHLSLRAKSYAVWLGSTLLAVTYLVLDASQRPVLESLGAGDWLMVAGIGAVLMLTTLLVQYGVTHTLATRTAVIFLFELVVAAITAYLLAGEALGPREWLGGTLIVAATLFAPKT